MSKRYIDADALKEQCFKFANDVSRSAMAFVQGQINAAPTADVEEVRHGEWIEQIRDYGKYCITEGYECSICGLELTDNDYNYCPNCGARMDGERKDNEN